MAQKQTVYDALDVFIDHMRLSADALETLMEKLRGDTPEDMRRGQDTIMEFGFLPATNATGNGPAEGDFLLEGSKILTEGPGVPFGLES